ncbi:MAG: DUF6935 domain-containing protein [Ruminococcus sp.]
MGLFDTYKDNAREPVKQDASPALRNEIISFADIPTTLEEFISLPQISMTSEYDTVALTVVALSLYPYNKEECIKILNYLRGPRPLSEYDKQFLSDRFRGKEYIMRSYFEGATPENDYAPTSPYTVKVFANTYSYSEENYANLYIQSGGADSPRSVKVRKAKDGKWYLWEQFLLSGIRAPESTNPWA